MLPISDETGPGSLGFSLKACKSIGCPTYESFLVEPFKNSAGIDHVHFQMLTTDDGSNEKHGRKLTTVVTAEIPNFISLDSNCMEHQDHLIVLAGLTLCDEMLKAHKREWKYFSLLAIFAHVVRELAKSVFVYWTHMFGSRSALDVVKKLFPRPDSGRWGCIHELEKRMLAAGVSRLYTVLMWVLKEKMDVKTTRRATTPSSGAMAVNTLALEQMKEHTERVGKYRAYVIKWMDDPLLEKIVQVNQRLREPIIHLSTFLKKKLTDDDIDKYGNHLAQVVNFKADDIKQDLVNLLNDRAYWRKLCKDDRLNNTDAEWLIAYASRLNLLFISEFDRRIWQPCNKLPLLILKLAKSAGNTECATRLEVVTLITDTPDRHLEITGRKLKILFPKDLELIKSTRGCMPACRLSVSIDGVKRLWKADVRKCEEMNKGFKLFNERVPNGSDALRSARGMFKHYLGSSSGISDSRRGRRQSKFRPVVLSLVDACAECWDDKDAILQDEDRFKPPVAAKNLPSSSRVDQTFLSLRPDLKPNVAHAWGACYNHVWTSKLTELALDLGPTGVVAIGIATKDRTDAAIPVSFDWYMSLQKVRTTRLLVPCTSSKIGDCKYLRVRDTSEPQPSQKVLGGYYQKVKEGLQVSVFAVIMASFGSGKTGDLLEGKMTKGLRIFELEPPSKKLHAKLKKMCLETETDNAAANNDEIPAAHDNQELDAAFNCIMEESEREGQGDIIGAEADGPTEEELFSGFFANDEDELGADEAIIIEQTMEETGAGESIAREKAILTAAAEDEESKKHPTPEAIDRIILEDGIDPVDAADEVILNDSSHIGNCEGDLSGEDDDAEYDAVPMDECIVEFSICIFCWFGLSHGTPLEPIHNQK